MDLLWMIHPWHASTHSRTVPLLFCRSSNADTKPCLLVAASAGTMTDHLTDTPDSRHPMETLSFVQKDQAYNITSQGSATNVTVGARFRCAKGATIKCRHVPVQSRPPNLPAQTKRKEEEKKGGFIQLTTNLGQVACACELQMGV